MAKSIPMQRFLQALFGDRSIAAQAAEIGRAILAARSLRRTEVAAKMKGKAEAAYKRIQRFLRRVDPRPVLRRLFREEAEFVLLDPTEVERPQARKTEYVGVLQDSKTRGFWLLLLATPHRGRAIPCGLVCYSSKTIADRGDSRNQNHMRAIETLKDIVGDRPVVMDREFSYLGFLQYLEAAQVSFVIRLNQGTHPKFQDSEGREVVLSVRQGQKAVYRDVWYKGEVRVHVIGLWERGHAEPLWVMSNLEPEEALRMYLQRMKIDATFRDLKDLLGLERLMNRSQEYMEKMVALLLLTYTIGHLVGENLRDFLYGPPPSESREPGESPDPPEPAGHASHLPAPPAIPSPEPGNPPAPPRPSRSGRKWKRYSGLFVLLMQKWFVTPQQWRAIVRAALASFLAILFPPVPTHVRT
jgi:hypothetical protein